MTQQPQDDDLDPYEAWTRDRLRPLGFHLKAEVLEYPGGLPGDIGFILTWK